jgi:galactonate dehydratase
MPRPVRIEALRTDIVGHWIFVSVFTEDGGVGTGESTYFLHPLAIPPIVDDLAECYVGEDAWRPEYLYQKVLKKHCAIDMASHSALSAIDQALWDIKAKALGLPVWELLGGRVRDKVRAILLIEADSAEEIVKEAVKASDEGFHAIKIKPFVGGWSSLSAPRVLNQVLETVREVRAGVGWDMEIAVEIHRNLPPELAIRFADLVRDQQLYFLEDPIQPFSQVVNQHVASSLRAPVAMAERNINIWEFRDYSDNAAVTILRPDAGLAGGFTQMRKIAAIAESRHQRILPHNFTSPLVTAVHVHCGMALHNWDLQGYVREDREPWSRVVRSVNRLENGYLFPAGRPGIGLELNFDYIQSTGYTSFGSKFGHVAHLAADGGVKQQ